MLKSIKIKDKEFKVAVADTDEKRYKGLSGLEKLGKTKGMLFVFPESSLVKMVMRDMNFDLDFIFLDSNFKIVKLDSLSKNDKVGTSSTKDTSMILEVNKGIIKDLKLKIGDILKPNEDLETHKEGVEKYKHGGVFQKIGDVVYEVKEDDIKIEKDKLQILNEKGEVTVNIKPGARIFSREHTKKIIETLKDGKDLEVGKLVTEILKIHDSQNPEYVKNN